MAGLHGEPLARWNDSHGMNRTQDPASAAPRSNAELDDELLAVRCQLGEPEAFDDLIARWHEPLWRYLMRTLEAPQEADDALQDTWLRVLRAFPALRDPSRLRPWLFGIARRALMDRLRGQYANRVDVSLEFTELPDSRDGLDIEWETQRADTLVRLGETLVDLPLVEREVLVLFYLQELSLTQLAEVLAVPVGTVKSRLFRARRMLRDRLLAKGVDA